MKNPHSDTATSGAFPRPPVAGSALLTPITSWPDMVTETRTTGVEFDLFWFESVNEGAAYFFRWLGEPRATVLVVWGDDGPTHVEAHKATNQLCSDVEAAPIMAKVTQLFRSAGHGDTGAAH